MQYTISLLVLLALGRSTAFVIESKGSGENQLKDGNGTYLAAALSLDEETNMEKALVVLNNLTQAQKQVWEQQQDHERKIQTRNREEEDREKNRSKALEQEQLLLKEIRGNISRKLKAMARTKDNGHAYNGNGGTPLGIPPKDCAAIYLEGEETSGVYRIWPLWDNEGKGLLVYCDMDTDGGGWTVIHRWVVSGHPKDYFMRNWNEYKNGFGDLTTSFWLGNEAIYKLTKQGPYELRFDFKKDDETTFSKYRSFRIEEESSKYKLHVEGYDQEGTAGDVLKGQQFYVIEKNRCQATDLRAGWWRPSDPCAVSDKLIVGEQVKNSSGLSMKIRPGYFLRMKYSS